uniref:Sodium/potassium-transporting ATPase subunit beta-1-interacting protein n=1 Tax=Anopheles darlingi TaxID=43151 RepID=A0A2M4CR45_ANODA
MGSCTRRHFLLSICFLQLLFVIERQVFDFLGYMWAPILVNFFQILFVIFGIFGAYQYRPRYLVAYSLWSLLWLGWNIFLICFYLNIGILNRDSDILNLGTGSVSWFEENGYGCRAIFSPNSTTLDPFRPPRPDRVEGCLLEYHIVEVAHSGLHAALAFLGIFGAICLGHTFLDEDDSFDFMGGDAKSPQHTAVHPMYVSYSSLPTTNSGNSTQLKQTASSAKLLLTAGDAGVGVIGDGGGQTHIKDQQPHPPQALTHPQPPNSNNNNNSFPPIGGPRGVRGAGGGGGGGGGVFMAKINGHGPPAPPSSIGGRTATATSNHSPSNTNTLLSSSSCSPSSTFTNIINNSSSSPQSVSHHPHHHGQQLANVQAAGHVPHLRNSNNSLNSGGSRVILLQHQDSSESSSSPPMVPTRGLSRNASFSKATGGSMGIGGGGGAPAALRKNGSSSSVSVLRYTDVTNGPAQQGQRADNADDDDTFFIPRSASSYQPRSTHFGISNPFNALPGGEGRNRGYRAASIEDGRRGAGLLSGSAHQLANGGQSSVPMAQKRNSLVGLPGGVSAVVNSGRGSPGPQGGPHPTCTSPPVPPLPQHFQRSGEQQPNSGNNAYLTRSPNLSRITRRQQQQQQHGNGHGASLTGSNGSMANSVNNNHNNSFNIHHHQQQQQQHHHHHPHHHNTNNNNGPGYFNRTGSSGRLTNTAHQCDQIREFHGSGKPAGFYAATPVIAPSTPPENNNYHHQQQQQQQQPQYQGALPSVGGMVMHRAKSQDRLAYRSRRPPPSVGRGAGHHHQYHQQQRPRSFCSNNGAYPDYVILEHPGN